jgi:2,4-dienoyl-CoA reductase-like NADH-dependent reductase (Old Yellow Enzyme family)
MLDKAGVDAVILSGGFTSLTPFYLMRGEVPLKEMVESEPNYLQKFALRFFGRTIIKKYPFQENFFLDQARQVRKSTKMPLVYVGGVVSASGIVQLMDEGFDMIALGRALIAEPDFLKKVRQNKEHRSPCDQCNICVGYMEKKGVECVL